MSISRDSLKRTLLLVFAGITSVSLLIASIALLIWATKPTHPLNPDVPTVPVANGGQPASNSADAGVPARSDKRFTLRLGQGFRFRDGAVVMKEDDQPDVVFRYVPPQLGGKTLRYNPMSQQVEQGLDPHLSAPMPLLDSAHIQSFDEKPNVARITSGDVANYYHQTPISGKTRYVLLMNRAGGKYLLTLEELATPTSKFDDWRIGFAYEAVMLPLGLAGGKINKPLPGKIICRDWARQKMIVRLDLTTGKEDAIADGILPTTVGERLLAYVDTAGSFVVRDAGGKILNTIRFNEQVMGPQISPDGTRLQASVYRPGAEIKVGDVAVPGAPVLSVAVFDLKGRELVFVPGYDDAAWTPDGKLIATGKLNEAGLFEIDPATKNVRPIDTQLSSPSQPSVSGDGKTIAFVTGDRVWLIDRDGKNLRQLYPHGVKQQRPAFSPDGTMVAAVLCNQLGNDLTGEVFVIDLKTKEATSLRTNTGLSLVPETLTRLNWIP